MQQELLPGYLDLKGSFEEQVRNIMQNVRLTRQEVDNLNLLYIHLEGALQPSFPGCKVVPFGSIVTGLGIKTSDVDCYIEVEGGNKCHSKGKGDVIRARNLLKQQPCIFKEPFAITSANVPIVKFFHIPTQRHCDINFKSQAGVKNSYLIAYLLHMDKRAADLAILIKYWAKVHNLTGTNMVPNYGLVLLVIFYLQQVKILPPVSELQKDDVVCTEFWNATFSEDFTFRTENNQSLYELLGGFFKFYSTVCFEKNVISPFTGIIMRRFLFRMTDTIPNQLQLYRHHRSQKKCKQLRIDTCMCIQDPFEHNRNCTLSVFPWLLATLVSHFKLAAQMYDENSQDFYIIDLLARKPPPIPKKQKNKGIQAKSDKPIMNGRVTKQQKKPQSNSFNRLETLYMNSNKMKAKKK